MCKLSALTALIIEKCQICHLVQEQLTFSSIYTHFNTLKKKKNFTKTLWKKVKLLILSNFTFFYNVSYAICILKSFKSHISVAVCSFFEFGTDSKLGKGSNTLSFLLPFPRPVDTFSCSSLVFGKEVKQTIFNNGNRLLKKCCQATTNEGGAKSTLLRTSIISFPRVSVMYVYSAGGKCRA